jgi:hypothetical protein
MTMAGYMGLRSPDRADAVVWGFTALFPQMTKKVDKEWRPPTVKSQPRTARRLPSSRRYGR